MVWRTRTIFSAVVFLLSRGEFSIGTPGSQKVDFAPSKKRKIREYSPAVLGEYEIFEGEISKHVHTYHNKRARGAFATLTSVQVAREARPPQCKT